MIEEGGWNMQEKIAIIGCGHVGGTMQALFPEAVVYDEPKGLGSREAVNRCQVGFVCVPTPMAPDGSCDTSIVEAVLSWLQTEVIVLRSTVPVGFTDRQVARTGKRILFQPEYYGETADHPFADPHCRSWITLGGDRAAMDPVIRAYQRVYNAELRLQLVDAPTAELAKYMENCFLATKVTFCNEFYDLAQQLGVDYHVLRETWLLDPRMGRSHSFVYPDQRGFGGACLPKDLSSMVSQAREAGVDVTLLEAVAAKNQQYTHQ
jgi:UDPglucose 6-dehydrogenase